MLFTTNILKVVGQLKGEMKMNFSLKESKCFSKRNNSTRRIKKIHLISLVLSKISTQIIKGNKLNKKDSYQMQVYKFLVGNNNSRNNNSNNNTQNLILNEQPLLSEYLVPRTN